MPGFLGSTKRLNLIQECEGFLLRLEVQIPSRAGLWMSRVTEKNHLVGWLVGEKNIYPQIWWCLTGDLPMGCSTRTYMHPWEVTTIPKNLIKMAWMGDSPPICVDQPTIWSRYMSRHSPASWCFFCQPYIYIYILYICLIGSLPQVVGKDKTMNIFWLLTVRQIKGRWNYNLKYFCESNDFHSYLLTKVLETHGMTGFWKTGGFIMSGSLAKKASERSTERVFSAYKEGLDTFCTEKIYWLINRDPGSS